MISYFAIFIDIESLIYATWLLFWL